MNAVSAMSMRSATARKRRSALLFSALLLLSSYAAFEFGVWEAKASTDADGDGLTYGLEFYINTQPQDWDSDNDGLPDGWEWQYGLDPLSATGDNGSTGDPDGDAFTNLNEYQYGIPAGWDSPSTPSELDNGVWWNGTVPTRNWDEESAMQIIQGTGSDGADEDPMGNICNDGMDNDKDGLVDTFDNDGDGDADCSSDDDDGDGAIDEDPDGWDTDGDGMPDGWEVANNLDPTSNSNMDGPNGDPDGDGFGNLWEYVNPAWGTRNGSTNPPTQYFRPGPFNMTATESPCNPILGLGPGGCAIFTAEVDSITQTDPNNNDTDGDGLNDSYEAFILLTDPTAVDTDGDGISDGVEVNGAYGDPPQATDPRNNNTDGDQFDDGEEDVNGNGMVDPGETDPTRIEDAGDMDNDGIDNWEENMTCTLWNVSDTDRGGVSDGDERSMGHFSDPCVSTEQIVKQITAWDSTNSVLTLNSTTGLDPTPEDWRQQGAAMAYYVSLNGSLTGFRYQSIISDSLRNVDTDKPSDATTVVFLNFSWCWNATVGAINEPHCDDDYYDTDGDGLADWEEGLGTWGYLSLPNMTDTDGDGVDDLNEILNQTDPSIACDNLLDTDEDGLNNYFENTTGCPLIYGIGGNGTLDTYYTMWNVTDTDNGGVADGQEYLDGTNPQNNSADDLNPVDTDGDGIPDTIEQQIGTDWRDPDTDGGGVPDGQECAPEYWDLGCIDAEGNPWDPTDDIDDNMLYFVAENTSAGVDPTQRHYWRWHTYDYYTGVSWGVNTTLVGYTQMFPEWSTTQGVADSSFWNSSEVLGWTIQYYDDGVMGPDYELIAPYNAVNFTSWLDNNAGLNFSNFTRDILIDQSTVDTLFVTAPQVFFGPEIIANSTSFSGSSYAYDIVDFSNLALVSPKDVEYVDAVTNTVINESGAFTAWEKVLAIQDYLINGNSTTSFTLNYDGSGRMDGLDEDSDIAHWIINTTQEGSCDEFTTVFSVMLRLAGIPTRKVTGFAGGTWTGKSFEVYGKDFTRWVEVHLETNQNQGGLDMGWIPFEACPPMAPLEVVDVEWGPTWVERNLSTGELWLNGTLQFAENGTAADNVTMYLYLVRSNDTGDVPGSAALSEHLIDNGSTDANGSFSLNGTPEKVINPGFGSLVIHVFEKGYVGSHGISFTWRLNISDDANLSIGEPPPTNEPMLGAGVNTTVSGEISWASSPFNDPSALDNLQVILNYTTSSDGPVSLITDVGAGGYYEFAVSINESEPLGLINASLNFYGWHEEDLNNASSPSYHVRPATMPFMFNVTPAPNLTVTLEAAGANNSILEIDSQIYLNGTVLSRGPNSEALNGTLILKMRRANTNGPYITLTSWYLNSSNWTSSPGEFSVNWLFSAADVPLPAGEVQVKLEFDSEGLYANDQTTLTDQFGIRSYVNFSYSLQTIPRGNLAVVEVILTDHTGTSLGDFKGTYILELNGTEEWNITDPSQPRLDVAFTPPWETFAGDYSWVLNFSGSTWLQPATAVDVIRIQGRANATVELGLDWTLRGTTNWVSGFANDIFHDIPILGNNSSVVVQLLVPSTLPPTPDGSPAPPVIHRLASGWIDNSTGGYNLSFQMPTGVGSGVYDLRVLLDFSLNPPSGGYYFKVQDDAVYNAGIQTEFVVEASPSALIVVAGSAMRVNATITDVEDNSLLQGVLADIYFDWGGPSQVLMENQTTGADGVAIFSPMIPANTTPGYYTVRVHAPDDKSDNLTVAGAGRWTGNDSFVNLTVQVSSFVAIDSIPLEVTAGQAFIMSGRVVDAVDSNRSVNGPMALEIFFLADSSETLIESATTTSNGSFTVFVPTDPLGNGVTSGIKTVVVSVINGSTPFYLTGTGNATILVRGVTQFVDKTPIINTVVDRGTSINFGARLVESSDNDRQIGNATIGAKFHDTWLPEFQTNGAGVVNFSFAVPHSHPLGLIAITLFFNGSSTLHSTATIITTITVRSPTILTLDPITDNPAAGELFTVSGMLTSSNGSAISDRDGNALSYALTFNIDGQSNTFHTHSVAGGAVSPNGSWSTEIHLDLTFPRGSHDLMATYTPNVNYYGSSTGNSTFDSRGYSLLTIVDPQDLDPDSRTIRGDVVSVNLSLIDNAGQPIVAESIDILIDGVFEWRGFTDINGSMNAVLSVDIMRDVGPMTITAQFAGINGTTGLLGDWTWTRVIILAPTELEITAITGSAIAGESVTFSGTLLDEHGQILFRDGNAAGGIIHLNIDGVTVGPTYSTLSSASTGEWSITYDLPLDVDYGLHTVTVRFLGGFTWVDPMGQGDSLNPEYYLPSSYTREFNATQTSQVVLTTPPGEVDRNELLLIEGMLTDGSGRVLPNRNLQVSMNGEFLTGLSVDENGTFSLYIPVPPDMELGPRIVLITYQGEEFILGSNSSTIFTVYGPVEISVVQPQAIAVGDPLMLSGTVKDNLPNGWLANHSLQIFVDGFLVGITSSDENGEWAYLWTISDFLEVGNHTLTIRAPEQGYHRMGTTDTVLIIAYHTGMTLQVDSSVVTRGGSWNFTGRLFDEDSPGHPGMEDRELTMRLDGEVVGTIATSIDGTFSYTYDLGYAIARGPHNIAFAFSGETYYLPTQYNVTVYTRADIEIEVFPINLDIIRGDPFAPIKLQGRILEIGGESNVMHNMTISLNWEDSLLPLSGNPWADDGTEHFGLITNAIQVMPPGPLTLTIRVEPDGSRYLNGDSLEVEVMILISVVYVFNPDSLYVAEDQRILTGSINVTALDTGQVVPEFPLSAYLVNGTCDNRQTSHFTVVGLTDQNGLFVYQFESFPGLPSFHNRTFWGEMRVCFTTDSDSVDYDGKIFLVNHGGLEIEYEQQAGKSFGFTTILVAVLIALAVVAGAGMLMRRRRQAAIDELAGVFSYTAELLAAGDEVRESIFNCYESLCQILMRRGFLRRDFETVREFEMAIRNALPISEQALVALDRIFEEARYSSHVLGEPHRQNAQMALSTVLQEIDELQEVPERDSYIVDDGIR